MAHVVFFEKPGCGGNARQKAALRAAGHSLEVRDLLTWPWTAAQLQEWFSGLPVADWFNRSAPRVRDGEILPERLSAEAALALMLAEPLLIRRPLLEAAGEKRVGWDQEAVDAWLGLAASAAAVGEGCPKGEKMAPCPAPVPGTAADTAQ
ncbi:MAG TPA: ArsC/Spx/MgsR family protein [Plasticicumulans sp.]|uniref:ArsC/Spx/MgsR family protein n=1 Tax=Plasticicumulans sp. TaxID=2307179 RepID=UPI002CB12CCE|nr:ArsC/Spx/MgsR family protein [Plasticicumulans sp.]HMW42005.1 ArsC/Spx/MgsR family protein [Plasticicumulans sp.]HNB89511.1 ArsC/Spx/MgsR family protein [Plasticicumulans sp.]HNG51557.1 ArsC/Spx/MgsR family protein [Plasticicumulans sp.]